MLQSVVRSVVRRIAPLAMAATALATPLAGSPTVNTAATLPIPHPLISEALFLQADANPPTQNNGTGLEAHNLWDLEVSLDVEWAHATAPLANIMLVTSPTAETLGVQGFQQFMNAEQFVIDHHMADVISQSFASGEGAFHNGLASLKQLRTTYESARANHVTILSSSGDGGSLNSMKEPVKNPAPIPYASVEWPASDPLVTAVGGTYLCTNAVTGAGVDQVSPPANCRPGLNPSGEREPAWVVAGGGYSIYFPN